MEAELIDWKKTRDFLKKLQMVYVSSQMLAKMCDLAASTISEALSQDGYEIRPDILAMISYITRIPIDYIILTADDAVPSVDDIKMAYITPDQPIKNYTDLIDWENGKGAISSKTDIDPASRQLHLKNCKRIILTDQPIDYIRVRKKLAEIRAKDKRLRMIDDEALKKRIKRACQPVDKIVSVEVLYYFSKVADIPIYRLLEYKGF